LGGTLSDGEMIQMYSRAKINLGFSTCGDTHKTKNRIVQVRLRDFEVPMSGGFYMVEYMDELKEFSRSARKSFATQTRRTWRRKLNIIFNTRMSAKRFDAQGTRAACAITHGTNAFRWRSEKWD
jgi:hypothetical protein